jgi:hypothetical protein
MTINSSGSHEDEFTGKITLEVNTMQFNSRLTSTNPTALKMIAETKVSERKTEQSETPPMH